MPDFVEFVQGANATPEGGVRVATVNNDGSEYQLLIPSTPTGTPYDVSLLATIAKQNDILTSLSNLLTELQVKADPTERQYVDIRDPYGFHVECTPMDELRTVTPFRLVGAQFSGTVLDPNFWTSSLGTGGSATVGNAQVILSTGTTANNSASIQSVRSARYVGGVSNRFRCVMRFPDAGTANNVRRWGAYSTTDGAFFELSGTAFRVVTRKTSSDTVVASANFNGNTTVPTFTVGNSFEIYWTNSKVYFVANGVLLHTVTASNATWSDTLSLPVRFETINSGGATGDIAMNMRTATIHRMGEFTTQPMSKYQAGTTAGIILKYGAGNLHGGIISGVVNNSVVTLRDGLTNTAPILWSSGAMAALTTPFGLEFHDIPFITGLFLDITGANSNIMVAYE